MYETLHLNDLPMMDFIHSAAGDLGSTPVTNSFGYVTTWAGGGAQGDRATTDQPRTRV